MLAGGIRSGHVSVWVLWTSRGGSWLRGPVPLCCQALGSPSDRRSGEEKGHIHFMSQAEERGWMSHLSFSLYHWRRLRASTKLVQIPFSDTKLQLKRRCLAMTAHSVQAELLWDAWKIILSLFLGRAPMIFQMTCSFGFLPHSCSVPWRHSFFTEKFDLLPVTAFVKIIPFLTAPRWAGFPCCRMLWVWLHAQYLSTFLLMDLQ